MKNDQRTELCPSLQQYQDIQLQIFHNTIAGLHDIKYERLLGEKMLSQYKLTGENKNEREG